MLTVVKEKEIIKAWDAVMKYRDKWIMFVVTDRGEHIWSSHLFHGYVACLVDSEKELSLIDPDWFKDVPTVFMPGYAADPYPQLGVVEYYEYPADSV